MRLATGAGSSELSLRRAKACALIALLLSDRFCARRIEDSHDAFDLPAFGAGSTVYDAPAFERTAFRERTDAMLHWFASSTGLMKATWKERNEQFRRAVSELISDDDIHQAAQFAVCVKTSSTLNKKNIDLRCTVAMEILDTEANSKRTTPKRLSLGNAYEPLLTLLNELEIPGAFAPIRFNLPFFKWNKWSVDDLDAHFAEMFHAHSKSKAHVLSCGDTSPRGELLQHVLNFPLFFRLTENRANAEDEADDDEEDETEEKDSWPPYSPGMKSRFVVCFGELAAPGTVYFSEHNLKTACSGLWEKEEAINAIQGLGASLRSESVEDTMFRVRSEILFGKPTGMRLAENKSHLENTFSLFGGSGYQAQSARLVAEQVGRLVRARILSTGVQCPRCVADMLGLDYNEVRSAASVRQPSSLLQAGALEVSEFVGALGAGSERGFTVLGVPPVSSHVIQQAHQLVVQRPVYHILTNNMVIPKGIHVAVTHVSGTHTVHAVAPGFAHGGAAVLKTAATAKATASVPAVELMKAGAMNGWHYLIHGGGNYKIMAAGGGSTHCLGIPYVGAGAKGMTTVDVAVKLGSSKTGGTVLMSKVVAHSTVLAGTTISPLKVILGAAFVQVLGVAIPAAVTIGVAVFAAGATYYGVQSLLTWWNQRSVKEKLRKWQLLMQTSSFTSLQVGA